MNCNTTHYRANSSSVPGDPTAPRFDERAFDELLGLLRRYLGEGTRIDVEFTDRIEMVRSGKHQGSISRLNIDFQSIPWREQRRAGGR